MGIAPAPWCLATVQEVGAHVGGHGDLHVEQGEIEVLALAGAFAVKERGKHRLRGEGAGHEVGHRHPDFLWSATRSVVGFAGNRHHPANTLDDEVIAGTMRPGAGLPESGHRAVDEFRIDCREAVVVEAVFLEVADLVVLDDHVADRCQAPDDFAALNACEIDRDRSFATVGSKVVGRIGGVGAVSVLQKRRPPAAGVVACARALDLDYVGAEVGQVLRAPGTGKHTGKIEDANSVEGAGHGIPIRRSDGRC